MNEYQDNDLSCSNLKGDIHVGLTLYYQYFN